MVILSPPSLLFMDLTRNTVMEPRLRAAEARGTWLVVVRLSNGVSPPAGGVVSW
jgi:hypothetical protein